MSSLSSTKIDTASVPTAVDGEFLRKARDISHNWAVTAGFTNVTHELIDLSLEVADALQRAYNQGRDSVRVPKEGE